MNEFPLALTTATFQQRYFPHIFSSSPIRSQPALSVVTLAVAVRRQRGQHTAHKVPHRCRRLSLGRGLQVLREGGGLAGQHPRCGLGGGGALAEVLQSPLGKVFHLQGHSKRLSTLFSKKYYRDALVSKQRAPASNPPSHSLPHNSATAICTYPEVDILQAGDQGRNELLVVLGRRTEVELSRL
jgi:hypothetical protein